MTRRRRVLFRLHLLAARIFGIRFEEPSGRHARLVFPPSKRGWAERGIVLMRKDGVEVLTLGDGRWRLTSPDGAVLVMEVRR